MKMRTSDPAKYQTFFEITDIESKIQTAIVETTGVFITCLNDKLIDHSIDSLDLVEIIMRIEDTYNVSVNSLDDELSNLAPIMTISKLATLLKTYLGD